MYLPETIRDAIITRLEAKSTVHGEIHRTPVAMYEAYPAYVLEYASVDNVWSATASDEKKFLFNLYVIYQYDNNSTSRGLAEKAISDAIGELYRTVFEKPGCLALANGWVRLSNASWGYGDTGDIPLRMAMLQIEVTVHQDRS